MVLVRHDSSGFAPTRLDTVRVLRRDAATASREFAAGKLDVVDDAPVSFIERLRPGDARVIALVGRSYTFIGWNLRHPCLRELPVRRALAQAVDVPALIRRWTAGQGLPARGPLLPVHAVIDTGTVLEHDRRAAARALAEAGFVDSDRDGIRDRRGTRLAFHILAPATDSIRIGIAEDTARDLRRVGAAVDVSVVRIEEFLQRLAGGYFEAFIGEWYPDPALDLDPVWRSTSTDRYNFGRFADPEVDRLLDQLWNENPPGGRDAVTAALQARVYGLQPYLFLFQRPHFLVLDPAIQGAEPEVTQPSWNLPAWWLAERAPRRRPRSSRTLARGWGAAHLPRRAASRHRVRRISCCR
jgi:peptide/nickel transport system substrate-binding protein